MPELHLKPHRECESDLNKFTKFVRLESGPTIFYVIRAVELEHVWPGLTRPN